MTCLKRFATLNKINAAVLQPNPLSDSVRFYNTKISYHSQLSELLVSLLVKNNYFEIISIPIQNRNTSASTVRCGFITPVMCARSSKCYQFYFSSSFFLLVLFDGWICGSDDIDDPIWERERNKNEIRATVENWKRKETVAKGQREKEPANRMEKIGTKY